MQEPQKNSSLVEAMVDTVSRPSKTDPSGSWTGAPLDGDAKPVQDADDL